MSDEDIDDSEEPLTEAEEKERRLEAEKQRIIDKATNDFNSLTEAELGVLTLMVSSHKKATSLRRTPKDDIRISVFTSSPMTKGEARCLKDHLRSIARSYPQASIIVISQIPPV